MRVSGAARSAGILKAILPCSGRCIINAARVLRQPLEVVAGEPLAGGHVVRVAEVPNVQKHRVKPVEAAALFESLAQGMLPAVVAEEMDRGRKDLAIDLPIINQKKRLHLRKKWI